jgi:hypothetical protein
MDLKITKSINVDFYNTKYISINAKQFDKGSRFILVSCQNNGEVLQLDNTSNYAYIRYRKADDIGVFNSCEITKEGKVLIEITEQMLSVAGKCYADLVIVGKNGYDDELTLDTIKNNGEIVLENSNIISTMIFCINVIETAFDNTTIESTYEFNALNDLLIKANDTYEYVIEVCQNHAENAKKSENNAKTSETNASTSENNAKSYSLQAKTSADNASMSEQNANISKIAAINAQTQAETSANIAIQKANEIVQSAEIANENATIATEKANNAINSAILSQSYAVGSTNSRENEDLDNSRYYYNQTKVLSDSLGGTFLPQGTITFEELKDVPKGVGYVYHISDDFVTDNTFRCGVGISCSSGTNVYYTSSGYWDFFIDKNFVVSDDNQGNVILGYVYNATETCELIDTLNNMVNNLTKRVNELEGGNYLEIT